MKKEEMALALWVRLLNWRDDPMVENDYGMSWCFFCGDDEHNTDCIWVEAKRLVKGELNEEPEHRSAP